MTGGLLDHRVERRTFHLGACLIGAILALVSFAPLTVQAGAGAVEVAEPALRGDGRVISIDGLRNLITVEHGPVNGLIPADRTEFPVPDARLVRLLRVGDHIAFTLVPLHGSHGVLSISALQVQSPRWGDRLVGAWRSGAVALGGIALLLVSVTVLVWRQGLQLRSLIGQTRAVLLRTVNEQHSGQREMAASLEALARAVGEALADFHSDVRQLGTRIGATRHGSPTEENSQARSAPLPVVLVRRGETETFRLLQERLGKPDLARVIWDRRVAERRQRNERVPDRRRRERRRREPVTWTGLGYLVVEPRGRHLTIVSNAADPAN